MAKNWLLDKMASMMDLLGEIRSRELMLDIDGETASQLRSSFYEQLPYSYRKLPSPTPND